MGAVQVTKAVVKGMIAKYSRRNKGDSGMGEGEIEESGVTEGSKRENEREEGRVVFVSSQAGQMGLYGFSSYSASKFALRGLAESLHMEVGSLVFIIILISSFSFTFFSLSLFQNFHFLLSFILFNMVPYFFISAIFSSFVTAFECQWLTRQTQTLQVSRKK